MVETTTLGQDEIEAMMDRVNSVPMMHTLNLEILTTLIEGPER